MIKGRTCGGFSCKFGNWEHSPSSQILCAKCAGGVVLRSSDYKTILTSGGYDPIHPGHLSCISDAAKLGDLLIVVVNGDDFLTIKKNQPPFMPLEVRCRIVSKIIGVDIVVPFIPSKSDDMTVCEALEDVYPDIFAKGGDRDKDNIPEAKTCLDLGITIVDGVGDDKLWSSSDFLKKWAENV